MPLAAGAFSEVVLYVDARGQRVALKTVLRTAASLKDRPAAAAASCAAEAEREARLQCLVAHANVVRVLQPPLGTATFTLEWCDYDIAKVLRGPALQLPVAAVKALFEDLLRGLGACHARGVLHRDVKPANLLIGRDGRLKLADFGSACLISTAMPDASGTTRWYRAPELLYGAREYGSGVDLWAAGCVLAELLGGAPLFPGQTDIDQLVKVQEALGAPSADERAWLQQYSGYGAVALPCAMRRVPLAEALPDADTNAVELVARLLRYASPHRAGAAAALRDAWFMRLPLPLPRRDLLRLMHHS